jgi:serine/threonine protein kinase
LLVEHGGHSLDGTYAQPVAFGQMADIIVQAADALDFLHANDVVHGDVNPGNVLIDKGRVRLVDFGLSGFLVTAPASANVTRIGTRLRGYHPQFSALEVHQGRAPSSRSDQFSLALVAQRLLCGEREFPDGVPEMLVRTSAVAREAFARALNYNPSERFRTCTAFAAALAGPAR